MEKWKIETRQLLNEILKMSLQLDEVFIDPDNHQKLHEINQIFSEMARKFSVFFSSYDRIMNSELAFFFNNIDEVDAQNIVDLLEIGRFPSLIDNFSEDKYNLFFDDFKCQSLISYKMRENEKMYNIVEKYHKLNNLEARGIDHKLKNIDKKIITVQSRIKKFHETSISILGFFTAIVFTVFGGLDMISKIFDKVANPSGSNIAVLILSGIMIFLVMLLTVNFLLVTIGKLSGNDHNDFKYNVLWNKNRRKISYVRILFYLSISAIIIIFMFLGINKYHPETFKMFFDKLFYDFPKLFEMKTLIDILILITSVVLVSNFYARHKRKQSTKTNNKI